MRKRRYKKSVCRNGWKTCGRSRRCYPPETVCRDMRKKNNNDGTAKKRREKSKEKSVDGERKVPYASLIAGGVVVTVAGASLAYVMTKKKEVVPEQYDAKDLIPQSGAAPKGAQSYDPSKRSIITTTPGEDQSNLDAMFRPRQSIRQRQESGNIGTPLTDEYDQNIKNRAVLNTKRENRKKAQDWAHSMLMDDDLVILDLETTGLMKGVDPYNPSSWRKIRGNVPDIVQIGMVDNKMNSIEVLMKPDRKISKEAAAVIGRDPREFRQYPDFKEYYPKLRNYLEGKTVIAFNSRFDMQVIDALCVKHNLPPIPYKNRPIASRQAASGGTIKRQFNVMDNNSDLMHWWALYLGKGIAPIGQTPGTYNPSKGLAFASLPTLPNAKAHDAKSDCFSSYDLLRIMASGEKPNFDRIKEIERQAWENSQ